MDSLSCARQGKALQLYVLATLTVDGRTETSFNGIQMKGGLCFVF